MISDFVSRKYILVRQQTGSIKPVFHIIPMISDRMPDILGEHPIAVLRGFIGENYRFILL